MQKISLCIIIVSYNSGSLVAQCLSIIKRERSHLSGEGISVTAVIVDNRSPDASDALIESKIGELGATSWARLIRNTKNSGFSAGNNLGIRHAINSGWGEDYFFLLNPDAEPLPGAIENLVTFARSLGGPAIVGCTQLNEFLEERPSAFNFPNMATEFQRTASLGIVHRLSQRARGSVRVSGKPRKVDWVTGAAFLLPRSIYEKIGPMDERFFLYFEEVEYMHRAAQSGFPCWTLPSAKVKHLAGTSTGIKGGISTTRPMPRYWYESWSHYFLTTGGRLTKSACAVAWLGGWFVNKGLSFFIAKRRLDTGVSALQFFRHAVFGSRDEHA